MSLRLSVRVRFNLLYYHFSIAKSFWIYPLLVYKWVDWLCTRLSFRYACWIQCPLWTHYQDSEWNNGKWLFSCLLMHCPSVEYLFLSHTWQIGGTCFSRWDHLFFFWVQSETVYTDLLFYTHDMKLGIWLLREAFYNDIRLWYPDENTWSLLYWKWCSAYKLSVLFDGLQNFVYDKYRDINHILWFLKFVLSYSKFDLLTVVLVLVWWSRF
jgi:hypothetical protein